MQGNAIRRDLKRGLAGAASFQMGCCVPGIVDGWPAKSVGDPTLTRRETEVARLASQALANKVIAEKLGIREGAVKGHLHNIYRKPHVSNRAELVASRRSWQSRQFGLQRPFASQLDVRALPRIAGGVVHRRPLPRDCNRI